MGAVSTDRSPEPATAAHHRGRRRSAVTSSIRFGERHGRWLPTGGHPANPAGRSGDPVPPAGTPAERVSNDSTGPASGNGGFAVVRRWFAVRAFPVNCFRGAERQEAGETVEFGSTSFNSL